MSETSTRTFIAVGQAKDRVARFSHAGRVFFAVTLLFGMTTCAETETDPDDPYNGNEGHAQCIFDHANSAEDAESSTLGEVISGYLCPEGDEDWFRFEVTAQTPLVSVFLNMDAPLSPVNPSYMVHRARGGVEAGEVVATPPAGRVSGEHDDRHCLEAGEYFLVVKDRSGDREDRRHQYSLRIDTAAHPDTAPRTLSKEDARDLVAGRASQGYIACAGEENWWSIEAPGRRVARVTLEREAAEWAPRVSIFDGEDRNLLDVSDESGVVAPTSIERLVVFPEAGIYYVRVSAANSNSADPLVGYELVVELIEDQDSNEPNDIPESATELDALTCGSGWSSYATATGTFAVPGDQDWFRLPLSGCDMGVIEAAVELDTSSLGAEESWHVQEKIQVSISLIRPHPASHCEGPNDCGLLQQACNSDWDCSGFGNICQGGRCAGSHACLGGGVCGARMVQRYYQRAVVPSPITQPPPPNKAIISAPIYGDNFVYLNVSDWQSTGADPNIVYELKVRVRDDPDQNEPSNLFITDRERSDSINRQIQEARGRGSIPVRDCTAGDCCGPGTWIEGAISYEWDEDFYPYAHPCPGEDCMLRIHYETDAGPVDFLFSVFNGNRLWTDAVVSVQERELQPAKSGVFGGLEEEDACFYAFQGHSDGLNYTISVRDLAENRDWDPDQRYRFCIEKIANECVEPPCRIYDNGCGN